MELTWILMAVSLIMGLGAILLFLFALKKRHFRNLEDARYQVLWSDLEKLIDYPRGQPQIHDSTSHNREHALRQPEP